MQVPGELEELRLSLEQMRTLLETLAVRGLRACGPGELTQLGAFADQLSQSGAGHLASRLAELQSQIERDDRASPRTLLETQTNVRLLERLLTLRVVKWQYAGAIEAIQHGDASGYGSSDELDETDEE